MNEDEADPFQCVCPEMGDVLRANFDATPGMLTTIEGFSFRGYTIEKEGSVTREPNGLAHGTVRCERCDFDFGETDVTIDPTRIVAEFRP